MRIRFKSNEVYDTGAPGKGPKFPTGFVLDQAEVGAALGTTVTDEWAEGFLRRWINRRVAEEVDEGTPTGMPAEAPASDEPVKAVDYATLTRAELDELAAKRGVDISAAKNKADVIAALEHAAG